jgi:anaerobic glycerol-3-phosphate dehydrogenase
MLFPLPDGHTAEAVRVALEAAVQRLPEHLWQSLTWDQGKEMAQHAQFTVDTGVQVYFCDPKSPWQEPSRGGVRVKADEDARHAAHPRRAHPCRYAPDVTEGHC